MGCFYGLFLAILFIGLFIIVYRKNGDVFSPLIVFAFFQFLRYVPSLFTKSSENGIIFTDDNLFHFFIIEVVSVVSVSFGYILYYCYKKRKRINDLNHAYLSSPKKLPQSLILFIYIVGSLGIFIPFFMMGGIGFALENIRLAYSSSTAYSALFGLLAPLSTIAIVMEIYFLSNIPKKQKKDRLFSFVLLLFMVFIPFASSLIRTRRSPILFLLLLVVFSYHFLIEKISVKDFFNYKAFFVFIFIFGIVLILPSVRDDVEISLNMLNFLNEFSYLGRDVGCFEYFSTHDYWFGSTYINVLTAPIPSVLFPNKPPVDDGLYLNNILKYGSTVKPPMPVSDFPFYPYSYNSWPFSTQGVLYANFGILGVILGEIMMGYAYGKAYNFLQNNRTDYAVIVYLLIVFSLELSSLRIVQVLIPLTVTFLSFKFANRFSRR